MFTYRLGRNLRNTQAIHALLTRISGDTDTVSAGPPGMKPKLVAAPTLEDQRRQLATHLHRLIDEQQFHPGQIAILTSTRRQISDYAPDHRIDGIPTTDRHRGEPHAVLFESIPRFKGLERDVVILVGVRELEYLDMRGALYVGASRARLHLIVIDTDSVLERLAGTR